MAVIKAARGSAGGKGLGRAIEYAAGKNKEQQLTRGIGCDNDAKRATEQMQATKEMYGKEGGREYKHYIQSFKPGEVSPEKALDISAALAKEKFAGHEVYLGVHTDKEHVHVHMVVNSVNADNGRKIQLPKDFLEQLKKRSDEICRENGLSVVDRTQKPERGQVRTYDMDKYQTMAQGKSYVANAYIAVDQALEMSQGKGFETFRKNMESQGYRVDLRGSKHITITDKDGNKVRGATLAKDFADDRMNRDNIMQTLGVGNQIDRQPSQKETMLPKMKTVQEVKQETNALDRNSPSKGGGKQQVLSKGAGHAAPQKSPGREPSRSSGGSGVASGNKMNLWDLMEQGYSEEAARKIVDMQDGFSIKLTGGSAESIVTDLTKKSRGRGR